MKTEFQSKAPLPTAFGDFTIHIFKDPAGNDLIALAAGTPSEGCLVRLHSECATGDIFCSKRCDCREQLELALRKIAQEGNGVLIYLRGQEGRGIGLANKIKAYALQDQGQDTVDANLSLGLPVDARDYEAAAEILRFFGVKHIRLMTNNTGKIQALEAHGFTVDRQAHWTKETPCNAAYVETKRTRMGHLSKDGSETKAS